MSTPWNTATDIWSFGNVVSNRPIMILYLHSNYLNFQLISLIYGGDFNLFRPRTVPFGHDEYGPETLKRQFQYFGPFPGKYDEIVSQDTVAIIIWAMNEIPPSKMTPFRNTTEREVCKADKEFIGKTMKLDWRDRPTAKDLLVDKWFEEDAE